MKKIDLLSIVLVCVLQFPFSVKSQDLGDWVAYSKKISIKDYTGKHFRLQAMLKTTIEDDSASARLWLRVDNGKRISFFDNMENRPVRNAAWTNCMIEGRIDSGMLNIVYGTFCTYNGRFYFKDIRLEIEIQKNKWQNINTENFESSVLDLTQGIQFRGQGISRYFTAGIEKDREYLKENILVIEGRHVPNYGINNKAGNYLSIKGMKLYYEVYGQGHPLVILHGNGGSIKDASPFYPALAKKYKIIAVDSRAQGRSLDSSETLTYEEMAEDLNTLLQYLKLDSAFIWGHSDGGITGLILAMTHPEKVAKIIASGANIQPDSGAVFQWALDFFKKNTQYPDKRKLNMLMLTQPNIPYGNLAQIKAQVLIMAGDRDMIRPEHTLKLFQYIPNSQLSIVPGATHFAAWEKQEFFLEAAEAFFDNPFSMPNTKSMLRN